MRNSRIGTDSVTTDEARILYLEGAVNVRDLGGLSAVDGQMVRRGQIYRSDVLYRLTAADGEKLQALGIQTVIDLRSRGEVEHYPVSPLVAAGVRHINIPLVLDPPVACATMLEDYLLLLRHTGKAFREIFDHLARDLYPVVINCFAGKDRTGLASALILGALGVSDETIVADYALSERHMARHLDLHRASDDTPDHTGALPDWLAATPETMAMTLSVITKDWGSVRGYLRAIGVTDHDLQQICAVLLEPTSTGITLHNGFEGR